MTDISGCPQETGVYVQSSRAGAVPRRCQRRVRGCVLAQAVSLNVSPRLDKAAPAEEFLGNPGRKRKQLGEGLEKLVSQGGRTRSRSQCEVTGQEWALESEGRTHILAAALPVWLWADYSTSLSFSYHIRRNRGISKTLPSVF